MRKIRFKAGLSWRYYIYEYACKFDVQNLVTKRF